MLKVWFDFFMYIIITNFSPMCSSLLFLNLVKTN